MIEVLVFTIGTAALAFYSKDSLPVPSSHGFHRFIAWEFMLLLAVLNLHNWDDDPLAPNQIISGILMSLSLFLVLMGYLSLKWFGQADERRNDMPLLVFEKTTTLITHGIYRYIRHPMYNSLILLDWGIYFKQMSWLHGCIALLACAFLIVAALVEERENLRYFGDSYQEYMKRSKRFIPFLL